MVNNVILFKIVTVHDGLVTQHLTDFQTFSKFWKVFESFFAAEKSSFQDILQFIFWTVFPCQDSTSIYGAQGTVNSRAHSKIFPHPWWKLSYRIEKVKSMQFHLDCIQFVKLLKFSRNLDFAYQNASRCMENPKSMLFHLDSIFSFFACFDPSWRSNLFPGFKIEKFLRMKWNKTEYSKIRRKSRSLILTFPSRTSFQSDDVRLNLNNRVQFFLLKGLGEHDFLGLRFLKFKWVDSQNEDRNLIFLMTNDIWGYWTEIHWPQKALISFYILRISSNIWNFDHVILDPV